MPSVSVKMDPVTVPELPEVNVAGKGEFELFFEAKVEPEKQMAYIVSLFLICCIWPNDTYYNILELPADSEALLNIPFVL